MPALTPRAVFVTRETEFEHLLARHATREQVRFFLEARGQSLAEVEARHTMQEAALSAAFEAVPRAWRRASVSRGNLDRFLFTPEDVVVAVGQDGLVANVAKYLTQQQVIGVNPDPAQYDGVLVRFAPQGLADVLKRTVHDDVDCEHRTMVMGKLDNGDTLLALNELFIGHRSHQSARYTIAAGPNSEAQSSSGVIVASGTGATGWARSIMLATGAAIDLNPTQREVGWFVREPFPSRATGVTLRAGRLDTGRLTVTSLMNEAGVVFADGIEHDFLNFGWGQSLEVGVAERSLNLVVA